MAIIFDAAAAGVAAAGTTKTFSHTCTGTELILFVGALITTTESDVVTGITYNSVAMTRVPTNGFIANAGIGQSLYLYFLIAPATILVI